MTNLCVCANLLKVICFVAVFVFFLTVVVTIHGEVGSGKGAWVCSEHGAAFQTTVGCVSKACVCFSCFVTVVSSCHARPAVTCTWGEEPSSRKGAGRTWYFCTENTKCL